MAIDWSFDQIFWPETRKRSICFISPGACTCQGLVKSLGVRAHRVKDPEDAVEATSTATVTPTIKVTERGAITTTITEPHPLYWGSDPGWLGLWLGLGLGNEQSQPLPGLGSVGAGAGTVGLWVWAGGVVAWVVAAS